MKEIKGYEGLYSVTSCGKVWSHKRRKFLKTHTNRKGYLYVDLCKNGKAKKFKIHRLVAIAYIDNPNGFETVDHIDNNKQHNYVRNLQWLSRIDNLSKERPNKAPMKIRCVETGQVFESQNECARALGINQGGINQVLSGKCGTYKGYHFERID